MVPNAITIVGRDDSLWKKNCAAIFPLPSRFPPRPGNAMTCSLDLLQRGPSSPLYPLRLLAECLQRKISGTPGRRRISQRVGPAEHDFPLRGLPLSRGAPLCRRVRRTYDPGAHPMTLSGFSPVLENLRPPLPAAGVLEGAHRSEFLSGGSGGPPTARPLWSSFFCSPCR